MKSLSKKRVIIFVLLLTALTYVLKNIQQNETVSSLFIMWAPGIAAIMTGLLTRRLFAKFGWTFYSGGLHWGG